MVDEYAEDGELDFSRVFTGMPAFSGHDSMRRQIDEFWETWEGVWMDPLEVLDIGGNQFVVDLRFWGKGRRSGVEIDQRSAFLYTLRESDGKVEPCSFQPCRRRWITQRLNRLRLATSVRSREDVAPPESTTVALREQRQRHV
jgi:hypothetical protein